MTFLIARPVGKAEQTAACFLQCGLQAHALALIDIEIATNSALCIALNEASPQCIVVTSTYAAQWLSRAVNTGDVTLDLSFVTFVCVGKASAELIASSAISSHILIASPENSEGVLQTPYLNKVSNTKIVILKGEGGRGLIGPTLTERNAKVSELDVYKRVANIPAINAFTFEPSAIRCIIATSIEITQLLLAHLDRRWLLSCTWIVASVRIKDFAHENGIQHILVSQGASNEALVVCAKQLVNTGVMHD